MPGPVSPWKERLQTSLHNGLFDQHPDAESWAVNLEVLAQGDEKSISSSPDAFSMDIRKYVKNVTLLGDFDVRNKEKHIHQQIVDPSRSNTITIVRGTPKASLLHHICESLELDASCVLEYYGFLDTFRIRSLPSRSPSVATVRFIRLLCPGKKPYSFALY